MGSARSCSALQQTTGGCTARYKSVMFRPRFVSASRLTMWQEIKPTVPSLKQIKHREKDLDRCVPVCQFISGGIVVL
jgi:hypothetical protein